MNTFIIVWFLLVSPSASDIDVETNSIQIGSYVDHTVCHDEAAYMNNNHQGYHYCVGVWMPEEVYDGRY